MSTCACPHRYGKRDKLSKLPGWITADMRGDLLNMSILEAAQLAKRFFREMAAPVTGKSEMDVSKVLYDPKGGPTGGAGEVGFLAPDVTSKAAMPDVPVTTEEAPLVLEDELTPAPDATPPASEPEAAPEPVPHTWSVRDLASPPLLKRIKLRK